MDAYSGLLGEFQFKSKKFEGLETIFSRFEDENYKKLNFQEKNDLINSTLVGLIQKEEGNTFLLGAVVDYMTQIVERGILENYIFSSFEIWLNQYSGLSKENNYKIRGKIAGKYVPRDVYQIYFPIGMGKTHFGTHFVTAHNSPDLDTTVASFWGWVDAFAARVGNGVHIWNVPGGPPSGQVEVGILFDDLFGKDSISCLAKTRLSLTLNSIDLMTQSGINKKYSNQLALSFDHERQKNAIILIDEEGYYLGDWRTIDVEGVRQVVTDLNNCFMWFEADLHIKLISCFAEKNVKIEHISDIIKKILSLKIIDSDPAKEFTFKQQKFVHDYLIKVLFVESGMDSTFENLLLFLEKLEIYQFSRIINWLDEVATSELFNAKGEIIENRASIFGELENFVKMLSEAFSKIRSYVDRLDVAFKIKTDVFGFIPQFLTHRTDIEEIRSKMEGYSYLTVNHTDNNGRNLPIGIVYSADLQKHTLGTVSLRDFSNREEMKIPSYLDVISVIDHHKSSLITNTPLAAFICDAQSSNSLVAQMAFTINDQYGLSGMEEKDIELQLDKSENFLSSVQGLRTLQRLLQKKKIFKTNGEYFVSPEREYAEYLHFIYAILDDTDLLTKVTRLDVECTASLLNRLKSLLMKKEVEIVTFDDIKEDINFTKTAAKRLLQNEDFYSLYSKVYVYKEHGVDENLALCAKGESSSIFSDCKTLNLCNQVGQTKIFAKNYPLFSKLAPELRNIWYQNSLIAYENNSELLLHLHMISTISSADQLFRGEVIPYEHEDELWIWIPELELAVEKLKLFLNAFTSLPSILNLEMNVEFTGENAKEFSQIFKESFIPIPHHFKTRAEEKSLPIAILRYKAGSINSRKAMIAPYLPRIGT